ncbi:DUF2480 family protein [Gynurincola endophyticus]|uniref:DUF2480 family protein n=1 Tax=Gynurincola endophyticus TaxID=2479004 RepID=UPI000F8F1DA3|nr:DUF2480 family protein [Gynurincola endophyticus]
MSTGEIVNRVANSGLITIDMADYFPKEEDIVLFDLKPYLFMEMVLKEKDFREHLKNIDWTQFEGKNVAIHCSTDAIIPYWAYMLVTVSLAPYAIEIVKGDIPAVQKKIFQKRIEEIDGSQYTDQRIVVKGCGIKAITEEFYVMIAAQLAPYVKSMMYGEPCSTVPIYKKK